MHIVTVSRARVLSVEAPNPGCPSRASSPVELFFSTTFELHRWCAHHQQPQRQSPPPSNPPPSVSIAMAKDRSAPKEKKEKKDKKDKKEKREKKEKCKDVTAPVTDDTTRVSKPSKKEKKDKKPKPDDTDTATALLNALDKNDKETKSGEGTSRGTVASAIISEVTKLQGPLSDLLVPFAKPLAEEKLSKKVLKTVKKGSFLLLFFFPAAQLVV